MLLSLDMTDPSCQLVHLLAPTLEGTKVNSRCWMAFCYRAITYLLPSPKSLSCFACLRWRGPPWSTHLADPRSYVWHCIHNDLAHVPYCKTTQLNSAGPVIRAQAHVHDFARLLCLRQVSHNICAGHCLAMMIESVVSVHLQVKFSRR